MCRAAHPAAGVSQRDAAGGRQPATRHSEAHVLGCRRRRRLSRTPDRPHARVATLAKSFRRTLRSDHSHRSRESVVAIGVGAAGLENRSRPYHRSTPGHHRGRMPVVGPTSTGSSTSPKTRLSVATGQRHAPLARGLLVPPILRGRRIVLFAFGLETAMHDTSTSWALVSAFGLVGGIALYLLAHIALRMRIGGGLGRGRPIASLVLLAALPLATHVAAAAALGILAAVCVALITYEVNRYHEGRALVRARRGTLSGPADWPQPRRGRGALLEYGCGQGPRWQGARRLRRSSSRPAKHGPAARRARRSTGERPATVGGVSAAAGRL